MSYWEETPGSRNVAYLTKGKLWLAPLAGFTDESFRTVCKKHGADVLVTEMVSADGLVYDFAPSFRYARIHRSQKPIGVQLFGSKPEIMASGAEVLLEAFAKMDGGMLPDFIDINMGCPVKKVVSREAGSALLKNLPLACRIVKAVKKVLENTGVFLSVKIRSGWDSNSIVALEAAKLFADEGIDFIIVHPRTRSQMYSGLSDWTIISRIKEIVAIPVIGNGDIVTPADAVRMINDTGCDSIMIGRGCLGKPWLFDEIKNSRLTDSNYSLSCQQRYDTIEEHYKLAIETKGYERAVREMKAHLCYYTKGLREGSKVRNRLNMSTEAEEMLRLVKEAVNGQCQNDPDESTV